MASALILITVLLGVGVALLLRTRLRIVVVVFLAGDAAMYGISRWLAITAPRVRGCAYLCSPREDAGVWLLFATVGLLVGGAMLLGVTALLLRVVRWTLDHHL